MSPRANPDQPDRRDFMKKACCVAIGGVLGAVPVASGVALYLDPLLRNSSGNSDGVKVRVTTLDALPADGVPRRFPILASRVDAWTKTPEAPIGAIYLSRPADAQSSVKAYNVICPHAGCFVDYVAALPDAPAQAGYLCPCHNSTFQLNGAVAGRTSPAPRGLDELECSIENGNEVWVRFQNFQAGTADKVPLGA